MDLRASLQSNAGLYCLALDAMLQAAIGELEAPAQAPAALPVTSKKARKKARKKAALLLAV